MPKTDYYIFVISDSVGATAEAVARAVSRQFPDKTYTLLKYPVLLREGQIDELIKKATEQPSVVVFTTVLDKTRQSIVQKCRQYGVRYVDIMEKPLEVFGEVLQREPSYQPGLARKLDDAYFHRIKAIEFAIRYDDGKDPKGMNDADLILIGVSRTSKTPLSMFLAYYDVRVINIPLVVNAPVPEQLFTLPSKKIIGLTIDPQLLNKIRQNRSKMIGMKSNTDYTDMNQILEELEFAEKIMKQIGCPIIDVSNKAIEETTNIILDIIK